MSQMPGMQLQTIFCAVVVLNLKQMMLPAKVCFIYAIKTAACIWF